MNEEKGYQCQTKTWMSASKDPPVEGLGWCVQVTVAYKNGGGRSVWHAAYCDQGKGRKWYHCQTEVEVEKDGAVVTHWKPIEICMLPRDESESIKPQDKQEG